VTSLGFDSANSICKKAKQQAEVEKKGRRVRGNRGWGQPAARVLTGRLLRPLRLGVSDRALCGGARFQSGPAGGGLRRASASRARRGRQQGGGALRAGRELILKFDIVWRNPQRSFVTVTLI